MRIRNITVAVALALVGCSGADAESPEAVASVAQKLIDPSCLTLHSPPPYPIVCGNYCRIDNYTYNLHYACSLASYPGPTGNAYTRTIVGNPCACLYLGWTYPYRLTGTVVQ